MYFVQMLQRYNVENMFGGVGILTFSDMLLSHYLGWFDLVNSDLLWFNILVLYIQ